MTTLKIWQRLAVALFLVFGLATAAYAANVNGRIKGTVTDASGAVLPGVQITATNIATGVKYNAVSAADGIYLFAQLPPGTYAVSASAPSFKKFTASGIVLNIDQEYIENIAMSVGSNAETVQVNASAVQVDTTDMQLSNVVTSEQMVELPIINRNFTGLELTLPGVQQSSDRFGSFSVSGAQTQQSEYLINGADTNDIALNTLAIAPNLDAIDQFNLIEGPLNAEYDRNSGGIVSATIKQGTNHFHGDAFEFYRDTFLNTLSYFQKNLNKTTGRYTGKVSPYHQNIFGGTVGGPILKDKLFFFGAYQGTRQTVPQGSTSNGFTAGSSQVYSSANLAGNFSYDVAAGNFSSNPIPSGVTIPGCTAGETWADCATALGGVFPTSAFNPISTKLVSTFVPQPNSGTYGYSFNPIVTTTVNQYIGRVDFALNPRNQFYGLFIIHKQSAPETLPFTGASLPGFGDQSTENITQETFDYVRQFSPTLVNDLAAHYTRFNYHAVEPQKVVQPSTYGFSITPQVASGAGVPLINVNGGNQAFALGFSNNGPQPRIDQVIQLDDTVSKVLGRHTFKFGYDGRRFNVSNPFGSNNNGNYSFAANGPYSTGDAGLDFLLGIPDTYSQGTGAQIQADAFLNYVFAQDTWKVTDALTLNYGLGYSIDTPLHNNQYGGEAVICLVPGQQSKIFPTAPLGLDYPGDPGCNNAGQATTRYSEFGPRLGFAWAPTGSWLSGGSRRLFAIRGGFGIYYDRTEEESALQALESPPFGVLSQGTALLGPGASPTLANPFVDIGGSGTAPSPFPYAFPTKGQTIDFSQYEPINNISTFGPGFRAPYAENMQLSVERQFPSQLVARVSYVGNLSRHNQSVYDENPVTPAGHAACFANGTGREYSPVLGTTANCISDAVEESVFFPQNTASGTIDPASGVPGYADISAVTSGSSSSYNSLQGELTKGSTHGLTLQLSYTYSHATDTASSFENAGFGGSNRVFNQFVPSLNYGDSAFDARQRLVITPLYIVPKFAGPAYNLKNIAFSGWEISGIVTLATGFPFDVSYGGLSSRSLWCPYFTNFYGCPDVPEQVAPIMKVNPRANRNGARVQYFGKTSFAPEIIGQFGNTHRNPAHGPGYNNTNVVLAKNFLLSSEHNISLQMRMESDNVFNHTNFNNPSSTFSTTTLTNPGTSFGTISGTGSARQSQLGAKFYF